MTGTAAAESHSPLLPQPAKSVPPDGGLTTLLTLPSILQLLSSCGLSRNRTRLGAAWSPVARKPNQESLGIARNVLTDRLNRLVEEGILERVRYSERPERYEYT